MRILFRLFLVFILIVLLEHFLKMDHLLNDIISFFSSGFTAMMPLINLMMPSIIILIGLYILIRFIF